MDAFVYTALPARAVFGLGQAARAAEELRLLEASKVLVCTTGQGARRYASVIDGLGGLLAGVFDRAEIHCPEPVAQQALATFRELGADAVVSIGGGSTIGLGKYIAVHTGRPHLTLPTTMSGSELTPLFGVKVGVEKRTQRTPRAVPSTVIYDPLIAMSLPASQTVSTGMNGLAHCIEALYPAVPNPLACLMAEEGIRAYAEGLPGCIEAPADPQPRARAMYGGMIGGLMVAMVGIGMHHKICHVLGGQFGVPHGESNSILLAHVLAYNEAAIPDGAAAIRRALGTQESAARAVHAFARRLGAPAGFRDIGIDREALLQLAGECCRHITHNPRPFSEDDVRAILDAAWLGTPP